MAFTIISYAILIFIIFWTNLVLSINLLRLCPFENRKYKIKEYKKYKYNYKKN